MPAIIDTHAHIDELEDIDKALSISREAGIQAIISMGSNIKSNIKVLELGKIHPALIFPAIGLHPWELQDMDDIKIAETIEFIEQNINNAVAIGEIGLDYDKRVLKQLSREKQKDVLKKLLSLAGKYNKPVSIHSRYAWKDCFNLVTEAGIKKAAFHWFTGFSSVLNDILYSGYYVSTTPAAEYHEEHRRSVRETPLEQLLLETDCPVIYGRENKYRSQPSDLLRSLKAAASIKNTDIDTIAANTTTNARRLFDI